MKKIYIFFAGLFLLAIQLKAQAPSSLNFQGVARNVSGVVLPNQLISLRFTIHQGAATGTIVYQETQSVTTTNLGLFTVGVGSGTVVSGNFSTIGWATNMEFLQVEMDPLGGTAYLDMGTNQYISVPYAFSAGTSASEWKLTGNVNTTAGTDFIGTTGANDLVLKANNAQGIRVGNAGSNVGIGAAATTPNSGAELDINSTTQGFLMPRLATNPVSPAQGMIYYNTTVGCVLYYTGIAWNPMPCPCTTAPGAPGPLFSSNGGLNFCASQAGVIYSVAPVAGVTTYTWAIPSATITSGAGSNVITVTFGTNATYALTLIESSSCGTSPTLSATLTKGTGAIITTQPVNAGATPASTVVFTVLAGGGGATYQWQVSSTGTGGPFTNVTNTGVYSGATTASLAVTNPPVSMNGYAYQVILTASCGTPASVTSSAVTLSVCTGATPSLPIVLTNSQTAVTPANLSVQITGLNFSDYSTYENANLNNVQFSTGPHGTGTLLYAWIENGSSSGTMPATIPTSSSTAATVWVNLGTNTIAASGGTLTIYMSFAASPVMTGTTGITGMAPQLTSTYGQFDNGALVFPTFYDNFAGTTLSSNWANNYNTTNGVITVNNGLALSVPATGNESAVISSANIFTPPLVAESYVSSPPNISALRSYMPGLVSLNATAAAALEGTNITDNYPNPAHDSYVCFSDGRAFGTYSWLQAAPTSGGANADYDVYSVAPTGYNVFGLYYNPTANSLYKNYALACNGTATYSPTAGTKMYLTLGQSEAASGTAVSLMSYWARVRVYPPSGTAPGIAFGTFGCY